ncbi:hypothetical protein [Synechococcus sp. M16CYN]|uniref:hypothetical protein n=1 Tax=Synechococcus sp. M16CYN TaxID=3103139 RepID=UPI0033424861
MFDCKAMDIMAPDSFKIKSDLLLNLVLLCCSTVLLVVLFARIRSASKYARFLSSSTWHLMGDSVELNRKRYPAMIPNIE